MSRYEYSRSPLDWMKFALGWVALCFGSSALLAVIGVLFKLAYLSFMFGWRLA